MAEETQQDGQKTIVAFIVGLLIGGMLVWAFSGPATEAPSQTPEEAAETTSENSDDEESEMDEAMEESESDTSAPALEVGDGEVSVPDQPAGSSVTLESATYPVSEGWIGVREFDNERLGFILGVVRFSESQGLVPEEILLQRSTIPGRDYAVVIFTEDGDFDFNLANDVQIDTIFDTFTAQ